MTKQEKIQEAYGEYWEQVKGFINDDGWVNRYLLRIDDITDFDVKSAYNRFDSVRPKSLQGIETNNGWIKIESEADLPKKDNDLWLIANDGSIILGKWCVFQNIFKTTYGNSFDVDGIKFTHYQPIIKPNPPIY